MGNSKTKINIRNIQKGKEEYALRLFDMYDKEKKGHLSREEAISFFCQLHEYLGLDKDERDSAVQQWFAYYDKDKKGFITKEEFVNSLDIAKGNLEIKNITNKKQIPCGSWESPFTEEIFSEVRKISEIMIEGDRIYWLERQSNGKTAVLQGTLIDKSMNISVLTPIDVNVGNRVNEFGGGSYCVQSGVLYYSNMEDGGIYTLHKRITGPGDSRYADFVVSKQNDKLYSVCEFSPQSDGEYSSQALVQLIIADGEQKVLAYGNDFYSSPRLNSDGSKLAYITWNLPNMPWDGCELWAALLFIDGNKHIKIAGGKGEYVSQPTWSPDGRLFFISNRESGWGNIWQYNFNDEKLENVFPHPFEFGIPTWTFRNSTFTFFNNQDILCCYYDPNKGQQQLALLEIGQNKHKLIPVNSQYTCISYLNTCQESDIVVMFAGGELTPWCISLFVKSLGFIPLRSGFSEKITIDFKYFYKSDRLSWEVNNRVIYGTYYYPVHPLFTCVDNEKPPLIVMAHDGPANLRNEPLNLNTLFWTSRGFGVLKVDYTGSWGYGRNYEKSVYRKWGIIDAEDCSVGALMIAAANLADPNRLIIYGEREGGFTALSCGTFYNVFTSIISISGISNLLTHAQEVNKFQVGYIDSLIAFYHKKNKHIFKNSSPFFHHENIRVPVLLIHAKNDRKISSVQSSSLASKLGKTKTPYCSIIYNQPRSDILLLTTQHTFLCKVYKISSVNSISSPIQITNLEKWKLSKYVLSKNHQKNRKLPPYDSNSLKYLQNNQQVIQSNKPSGIVSPRKVINTRNLSPHLSPNISPRRHPKPRKTSGVTKRERERLNQRSKSSSSGSKKKNFGSSEILTSIEIRDDTSSHLIVPSVIKRPKSPKSIPVIPPMPSDWSNQAKSAYISLWGKTNWEKYNKSQFPQHQIVETKVSKELLKAEILGVKATFGTDSAATGRRATHSYGVGGCGFITILNNPDIPEHEFFKPGRQFSCRVRHSNTFYEDDACLDTRALSIKFHDSEDASPLDIIMQTGYGSGFWNCKSFNAFTLSFISGPEKLKMCLKKYPQIWVNSCDGLLRRAPSSYSHCSYYSQLAFKFQAIDGVRRYVKYRVINNDPKVEESGIPIGDDQRTPWYMTRLPTEKRPTNYLKMEFKERLSREPIVYKLQIQLHEWNDATDNHFVFCAGYGWDVKNHPWMDLATIEINKALDDSTIEATRFNIANSPDSLGVVHEYLHPSSCTSIGYIRSKVYRELSRIRIASHNHKKISHFKNPMHYVIVVSTGDYMCSGDIFDVKIQLHGLGKSTDWHNINCKLEKGVTDQFSILDEEVSPIQLVSIETKAPTTEPYKWFLKKLKIIEPSTYKRYIIPCFRWFVGNDSELLSTTTSITNKRPLLIQQRQAINVERKKRIFRWGNRYNSFPGYLQYECYPELPTTIQFEIERKMDFNRNVIIGDIEISINYFKSFHEWTSPEDYVKLLPKRLIPLRIYSHWNDDLEFGYQIVNGVNPKHFIKITEIPPNFPVTNQHLDTILPPNTNIETELKSGRIYLLDYKILEGVPVVEGRYVTPAMCLLYLNIEGKMTPIAIQLKQKSGDDNPIFTPKDGNQWTIAKLFVKCADAQIHQLVYHLLESHLVIEPFTISAIRNFSENHPVFKIIWPHMKYVMAINTLGRQSLLDKNGVIDKTTAVGSELIIKAYKSWHVDQLILPQQFKKRGVENVPNYYFFDDSMSLWNVIEKYVEKLLRYFYKSDTDIPEDKELQNWIADVAYHGHPGHVYHSIPTTDDLIILITSLIWTCTGGHNSVNAPQFYYYCFIPNYPYALRKPPPTTKEVIPDKDIVSYLPGKDISLQQIAVSYYLTTPTRNEIYLQYMKPDLWEDTDLRKIFAEYLDDLERITKQIEKRNSLLKPDYAYNYLRPDLLSSTLSI